MKNKTSLITKSAALIIISAFILMLTDISCQHHSKIISIKENVNKETKNIVININISKFTGNNRKENKNLSKFNKLRQKELDQYSDTIKSQADRDLTEIGNNKYGRPSWKYGLYVTDTVIIMIPGYFISILQTESTFTGGAHPNNLIKDYNYDIKNNKLLKKGDIINLKDSVKINKILRNKFKAQNKYDIELFEQPSVEIADAIALTRDSVIFVYNQYTLACYAAGPIKIKISQNLIGDSFLIKLPDRLINQNTINNLN